MGLTATERLIDEMNRTGNTEAPALRKIRCKNCIYCKDEEFVDKSTCRESPPYFQRDGWSGWRRWPEVDKDKDWCGMFKSRLDDGADDTGENLAFKFSILKKALKKINDGIVRTGPNSIGTKINLIEVKTICETALNLTDKEN